MTNTHRTPESACLACGYRLTAAGSPDGSPIEPPNEGDITVCLRCGAVMRFDSEGRVRGMTDAEIDEITADTEYLKLLAGIVRGIHFIRTMRN